MSNYRDEIEDTVDNVKSYAKKNYKVGKREAIRGSEDWVEYVKSHPLQSVAFGAVILLAIKALLD